MNLLFRGKQNAGSLPGRNTSTSSRGWQEALLAAGEASVGLRTGRTQAEPSPHHTRVAVNCGLQGHTLVSAPGLV